MIYFKKNNFILLISLQLISLNINAQWLEIKSPIETINSIAVNDKLISIGSSNGVYIYRFNERSWQLKNKNLSETILNISYSSKINQDSIYERIDVSSSYVNSIISHEDKLYIGTRDGVYVSKNNGETWETNAENYKFNSIIIKELNIATNNENTIDTFYTEEISSVYANKNKLYSITNGDQISSLSSTNELSSTAKTIEFNSLYQFDSIAKSWDKIKIPKCYINSVIEKNNKLFISTDYGLFSSENKGISWNSCKINNSNCSKNIYSLIEFGRKIIVSNDCGLFESNDNGVSWNNITPLNHNYGLLNSNKKIIILYNKDNLIHSIDSGKSWSIIITNNSIQEEGIKYIASNSDNLFLVTNENKIWQFNLVH